MSAPFPPSLVGLSRPGKEPGQRPSYSQGESLSQKQASVAAETVENRDA